MPSVQDMLEIAQSLEGRSVEPIPDKCVAVRNRNASCEACVDVCPVQAIAIANNTVFIDHHTCTGCQACVTACPMGALVPAGPSDDELTAQVLKAATKTDHLAVIACARIASKCIADPITYTEVPCTCRVDESFLIGLIDQGIQGVLLVDGDCSTCKYRATQAVADRTIDGVNDLLQRWGSDARVWRDSSFPSFCELPEKERHKAQGEHRRRFFVTAREDTKRAAQATIANQLHIDMSEPERSLQDMFSLKAERRTLPQFHAQRQLKLMDSLDDIGNPTDPGVPMTTRLWGNVSIDTSICSACGICLTFCPTGALYAADDLESQLEGCDALYHFWAAECTQCHLCEDVCLKHCITVSSEITPGQLIDFEPKSFRISR